MPEPAEQAGQIRGDLRLPTAGEPHLENLLVCPVGRCGGRRQPLDLRGILDGAQHRQAAGQ